MQLRNARSDLIAQRCEIAVESVRLINDDTARVAYVSVLVNGFRLYLSVMARGKMVSDLWVKYPSRQTKTAKSYPLVWPIDDTFRATIEKTAILAFRQKRLEAFNKQRTK